MQTLTIGCGGDLSQIKNMMLKSALSDRICKISFERDEDTIKEIKLTLNDEDKSKLYDIMSRWIINKYEKKLLRQIINCDFREFPLQDRKMFFEEAKSRLENSHKDYFRAVIKSSLSEHFESYDRIYVDGFVRFRIKEYRRYLSDIVEDSVDDLLVLREYEEFIALIKKFIEIQPSEMDFLHIIVDKDKKYRFYNRFETDISDVCIKEFIEENLLTDINYDDLLISTLIALVPKKIMLHKSFRIENSELIKTISEIFGDRLIICKGCELCNNRLKDI